MSDRISNLRLRLQQLQSRFTWDLRVEDMDLDDINIRLEEHIELQGDAVARSFSLLAYVRYLQGQPEEALSLLKQSEEKTKECDGEEAERRLIVTYGDMAWLRFHAGDYTEAEEYCQRVEDILLNFPTDPAVLRPEVYGEKAWTYFMFSRSYYPKAIECFQKALQLQNDDSEWNTGYAMVLQRTEERACELSKQSEESAAVKQLRRALELDPDNGVLLCLLALDLIPYKKHGEASGLMERALRVNPDHPHVLRYIGKYYRKQGQIDEAIDLLKQALERTSQSPFIHHQLAQCYKTKKIEEQKVNSTSVEHWRRLSIQHLEEAVKIRPSFVAALADLALLYGEQKDLNRAEELFQSGLKMLPVPEKYICTLFYQRYGDFHYYHTGNEADAIKYYTEALRFNSKSWEWSQCIKMLKKIAERRP
ncbi:interferon-induced protein with tetratricopeptide repeats 1-like [Parambassis ranga]|uniref:Interferon-induced protein with tetratricopeptide repeats 1-like n=1 Tax=Parambassis ranga TaxID=210632 RepID=A0A6P7I5P9_9TELE|nr:interferon-induced protein with tetratricopeptide repeats 1-like [Parambassis ranga]